MKKSTYLFFAVLLAIFTIGAGRSRYSPYYWVFDTGGIKYTGGNVDITSGTLTVSGIVSLATDTYAVTKTIVKTIDLDTSPSTDDFQFNNTIADSVAQNVNLGLLVPAWAEIISCKIRCFETVGSGTFQVKLGTSSGSNNLLAQAAVDSDGDLVTIATAGSPVQTSTGPARNVWIQGDPSVNWNDAGAAGRWIVMVTYIDYAAVFTAKNP